MVGTTKLGSEASRNLAVVPGVTEGVLAPAILILVPLPLIGGCGPPI
jgi:hypothetical protein